MGKIGKEILLKTALGKWKGFQKTVNKSHSQIDDPSSLIKNN